MERKKLLIDVDEVICNSGFLPLVNEFKNTNYKIDDFTDYYLDDYVLSSEKEKQEFYKYYLEKNSYDYATLLPDTYEVLEKLNKTYDIYICSACVMFCMIEQSGKFFMDKYDWLIKTFPFLDQNKIILTNSKNIFKADIQIDDRLSNLEGEIKQKLLFTSYHNKNISDKELNDLNITRVNSWKDIEKILL